MGATLRSVRVVSGGTDPERVAHATIAAAVNPTSTKTDAHASGLRVRVCGRAIGGSSENGSLSASSMSSRASRNVAQSALCGPSRDSGEAARGPVGHVRRQRGPVRLALDDGGERLRVACAGERGAAREHLVQHTAEGPDVGPLVDRLAARLLRDSCRRPCRGSSPRPCGRWSRWRSCDGLGAALLAGSTTFARPKSSTFTMPSA